MSNKNNINVNTYWIKKINIILYGSNKNKEFKEKKQLNKSVIGGKDF